MTGSGFVDTLMLGAATLGIALLAALAFGGAYFLVKLGREQRQWDEKAAERPADWRFRA